MATVTFIQGDTINEVITIKDKDLVVIDISSGTVKFRIVAALGDLKAGALFNEDDVTITDGPNGEATLTIARAITKLWSEGKYYWEVEYIDSSSNYSHTYSDVMLIKKSIYVGDS